VANTARIYIEDALKWLIDDEVATAVTVATNIQGASRLDAIVLITRRDGTTAQLRYNWAWAAK
jgi:phage gp46-like protein